MRILITGANGFIARQFITTLLADGHDIIAGVRGQCAPMGCKELMSCDFNRDTTAAVWEQRLRDHRIDAVINAVGILQGGGGQSIKAIHQETPIALFQACENVGIQYVLQISALGAGDIDTEYAQTKAAADTFLQSLSIPHLVCRPSVIYGSGSYGGTSLFRGLSGLPWFIPLVGDGQQLMAPIYLPELAQAISHYIKHKTTGDIIYPVGSEQITMRDMLLTLREWLGFSKVPFLRVPLIIIRLGAVIGDFFPRMKINTTSYKMLQVDNVHDPKPFFASIPFKPRGFREVMQSLPSQTQDRWHARLYLFQPLVRSILALVWIVSGLIPFVNPEASNALLSQIGVPEHLLTFTRVSLSCIDLLIGFGVLLRRQIQTLGTLQLGTVMLYTIIATITIPAYWLDPLGSLLKNIPILALILVWMAIDDDR